MSIVFSKLKRRCVFINGNHIHLEEVDVEFAINIMEFVFELLTVFKGFLVHGFEIAKIIRTFVIDTFMNGKEFAVFLGNERMTAKRALEF